MIFKDRKEAGIQLSKKLLHYRDDKNGLVLGLPRGGVVTAFEVAKELHLPLDVICPMKIGAPTNPEYAIGAITETGEGVFNKDEIRRLGITDEWLSNKIETTKKEAQERLKVFRAGKNPLDLKGKDIIIVDDGLATGLTMKAAIQSLKLSQAKKIIVAVPVSPIDTFHSLQRTADEIICLQTPYNFYAVGQFYELFGQTTTEEVVEYLHSSKLSK